MRVSLRLFDAVHFRLDSVIRTHCGPDVNRLCGLDRGLFEGVEYLGAPLTVSDDSVSKCLQDNRCDLLVAAAASGCKCCHVCHWQSPLAPPPPLACLIEHVTASVLALDMPCRGLGWALHLRRTGPAKQASQPACQQTCNTPSTAIHQPVNTTHV